MTSGRVPRARRRALFPSLRFWAIWQLPRALRVYVIAVVGLAVGLAVALVPRTAVTSAQVVTFVVLSLGAALTIEASRRLKDPSGVAVRDLLAAWTVPVMLLLPPAWSLLAPVPSAILLELRVGHSRLHRRVFTAAAIGVAGVAGSSIFHGLLRAGGDGGALAGVLTLPGVGLAVLAAVTSHLVNLLLVVVAVRTSSPETTLSQLLLDRSGLEADVVEVAAGVMVAVLAAVGLLAVVVALPVVVVLQRCLLYAQVYTASRVDGRTGLLNGPTWEREADAVLAHVRPGSPSSVLLLDLDHFKAVNDTHGHAAGDEVLARLGDVLRVQLRQGDLLGRVGGEEFAVLLPRVDLPTAVVTAERVRRAMSEQVFRDDGVEFRVTASIGVAEVDDPTLGRTELLAAADRCLYAAKAEGRDLVRSVSLVPAYRP